MIDETMVAATEDHQEKRIAELEMSLRDALRTILWFEGWLNNRTRPVQYDPSECKCGHLPGQHSDGTTTCWAAVKDGELYCTCDEYIPKLYHVSYAARDVNRVKISIAKALRCDPEGTKKG